MTPSMSPTPQPRTSTRGTARGALVASALVTAFALQVGTSAADDTEVYFGQPSSDSDTNPNVLFVLDTSGSMGIQGDDGRTRLESMKEAVKTMLRQANDINVGLMKFNSFSGGGPILFPVTDIDEDICEGAGCDGIQTSASIASDLDDVEEYVEDDNDVLTNGTVLELIDTDRGKQSIGLRFTDLEIPRGASIVDARLDLMAERDGAGGEVTLDIRTENSGDSVPFTGADKAVSSRPWHVSKTSWTIDEDWEKGQTYTSENLASIVAQVTSRADWCGGNALALRLEHGPGTTADALRHALTFRSATQTDDNGDAIGQPATLRVTYKLDSLPSDGGCMRSSISSKVSEGSDDAEQSLRNNRVLTTGSVLDMPYERGRAQEIGVRFPGIRIPQGATIRRAWMEFRVEKKVKGDEADDISIKISGESSNDAAPFSGAWNNVGQRAETGASVVWSDLPNARKNATVTTEDVTPIVQEIVDRSGWESGNAMAFLFTQSSGTGKRRYMTYEKSRAKAPRFVVEFDDEDAATSGTAGTRTVKVRDELISLVDSFVASGGTPIVDSLWEASQYYRGGAVEFGKKRGSSNKNYNRVSHPDSYTGGTHVIPNGCTPGNLNASQCNGEVITGNPVYVSPIKDSCQTNHIVFLSDGEAVTNSSAARIRDLTGVSACESSGDEACGTELAQWLYESDLSSSVANRQNVRTHTIAYDLDDANFLDALARKGGGKLYEAKDSATLLSAFRRIIDGVNSIDTSFTAPGATVNQFNRLTHRDDIYFAMFKPSDVPRWSGNLKKFRIGARSGTQAAGTADSDVVIRDRNDNLAVNADTGFFADEAFSFWEEKDADGDSVSTPDGHDVRRGGAANQLPRAGLAGLASRRTYTWTGSASAVPAGGVDLTAAAQRLHEDNAAIDEATLGVDGLGGDDAARATYRENLLAWARGVDVLDEDDDPDTDSRRHMGDPMHTRPVILNYADASATEGVRSIVFVATNEGYLHAIDTESGQEQFAYMPGELLGQLLPQFENETATTHLYGLDGHLSVWRNDVNQNYILDPGDKAYLFIGMRRGGGRYYALDVSNVAQPRLVWAIEAGSTGFEELGQSWSRMAPVRMRINGAEESVLLFGGGYDEAQDDAQVATDDAAGATSVSQSGRGLYIVRVSDGKLLWSGLGEGTVGGTQTFADMKYPIPGNLRPIDVTGNGLVDQIYAADTGGQVWRFDLDRAHTSGRDLMEGGVIADLSGSDTADKRRFYAEPDVALVEKGGESYLTVSIGSGWRAHPLDEKVQDRFYVLRQKAVRTAPGAGKYGIEDEGRHRPITDADLTEVTDELDPDVGEHGWFLDLGRPGEKVLGASVTFDNSVVFSTYVPQAAANDCSAGLGGGRAYVLDLLTGAPRQDFDEDNVRELEDRSVALKHEGLPPDAMIMLTQDGERVTPKVLVGLEQFDPNWSADGRRTFWADLGEGEPIETADTDPGN